MSGLDAGSLDRQVEIQAFTRATGVRAAGKGTWATIADGTVWASVHDMLPSRSEGIGEGIEISRRPARVRMRYRDDITSAHRLKMGNRIMKIVAGPAEIGRCDGIELMVVEYSDEGEAP